MTMPSMKALPFLVGKGKHMKDLKVEVCFLGIVAEFCGLFEHKLENSVIWAFCFP